MTNLLTSQGGVLQSTGTSPTSPAGTTPTSPAGTVDLSTLAGDLSNTPLVGGTGDVSSAAFDPSLYEPGGLFSPTTSAQQAMTPAAQQAQQDPSGQVPLEQQVDRTAKGDQPQTVDRTDKGDLAQVLGQPPAGPSGTPGDPQQTRQAGPQPSVAGAVPGLPQLAARQAAAAQGQPSRTAAVDQPTTPQPAAAATPQAAAPPAGGQRQPAARAATGPVAAAPGAQPSSTAGVAPAGVPGLLQAILNMLGLGGLTAAQPLQGIARQAYPQRMPAPISPTGGLGPYARARARGAPGQYQQPSQQEWTRNVSDNRGLGPAPGQTDEVAAPTDQQVQQSRLAGTDTPPTAGFSSVLERERGKFRTELDDPRTKWETLAVLSMEHSSDPAAVAESLLNRSDYARTSIRNMIHSGFYGPVNFGLLGREIRRLQANPEYAARLNAGLETALRGSNLLGGATDQGSHRDPNVGHRGGRVIRFGETYNDWGGGPGGHDGAASYRRQQQQRVRAGDQQAKMGREFAMDITRRLPGEAIGVEMGRGMGPTRATGGMFQTIDQLRRKRERDRQEAEAS